MRSVLVIRALVIALATIFLAVATDSHASEGQGLTVEKLEAWLKSYGKAWESKNANKAIKLFSTDATYRESPFDAPFIGRKAIHDYWSGVTKDQKDIKFTSKVLALSGNRGVAHWHAELSQPSTGSNVTLDGIFVLDFAEDGLCQKLEEWWHVKVETEAKASN